MQRVDINDFTGGIEEQFAADNFSDRQWAKLKGFVMDTDLTMRTQWAAQSVGGSTAITSGAKSVSGFTGSSNSYLVAISNDGDIWWAIAPSDTANYTVSNAASWTKITGLTANPDYRFITEMLLPLDGIGEVNALLIHCAAGTTSAIAIYENDLTGGIATKTWDRFYPVDQPQLIDPLPGEVKTTATATTFTATSTYQSISTFTDTANFFTVANDGPNTIEIKITSGGSVIRQIAPLDSYTHTTKLTAGQTVFVKTLTGTSTVRIGILLGSYPLEMRNVMPRANVGTMWRNRLILGDVVTRRNSAYDWVNNKTIAFVARSSGTAYVETTTTHGYQLGDSVTVTATSNTSFNGTFTITAVGTNYFNYANAGSDLSTTADTGTTSVLNRQRSPYSFYYSEDNPDAFHEQSVLFAGSGESQILGMHVLDDYLITISSPATESDGLRTFKGALDYLSLQQGSVSININVLRGGIGPTRDLTASGMRVASCVWAESGTVVFLDYLGGVWYTDGIQVDRLDHVGPVNPDVTTATDEVAAIGRYLFVKRAGRYLVLNMMGGTPGQDAVAAWTEMVFPSYSVAPKSFSSVSGSMYFVMDGRVYRFCVGRNSQSDTERLTFDNVAVEATVATRTLADTNQHQKVNWFRFGMRTRGRANTAQVRTVQVKAGPALDTSVFSYSKTLNRNLVDRDEFVLPAGIGSTVETSAEVTFRGDLQLESATYWLTGGKFSRPGDGSDA
jgi:hypothetical protein